MKNPFSFEAFADWAEKKRPDEYYNYTNSCVCACAQYADTLGVNFSSAINSSTFWRQADNVASRSRTFGKLAEDLRKAANGDQDVIDGRLTMPMSVMLQDWVIAVDRSRLRNTIHALEYVTYNS